MTISQLDARKWDGTSLSAAHGDFANAVIDKVNEIASAVDAADTANTDVVIAVPILAGVADAGTWTKAVTTGGLATVTKTAAAAAQSYWIEVPTRSRSTALTGLKLTSYKVNYQVGTTNLDDVRIELWKVTQGAEGSARTAAVVCGQTDGHYDTGHDTAAERANSTGGPHNHQAVVTVPTPAFLGAGESYSFRVYVDGDAGPTGTFALTSLIAYGTEDLVDEA